MLVFKPMVSIWKSGSTVLGDCRIFRRRDLVGDCRAGLGVNKPVILLVQLFPISLNCEPRVPCCTQESLVALPSHDRLIAP